MATPKPPKVKMHPVRVVEKPVKRAATPAKAPGTSSDHKRATANTRAGAKASASLGEQRAAWLKANPLPRTTPLPAKPQPLKLAGGLDVGKFIGEVSANVQGALGTNKAQGLGKLAGGWAPGSGLLNPKQRR